MTECVAWDATLALVRWQRTRRGYDNDAILLQTGLALLQPDADLQFGPQSALARTERAFNLPWQRIVSEVLQFAVYLVTKAKLDENLRPNQKLQALRLLQLALNALTVKGDAQLAILPLNSCNLLLSALAETLEKVQENKDTLQILKDVKAVLFYLFGLPNDLSKAVMADFQMYRPPTNVFTDFLKRIFTAAFASLTKLQEIKLGEGNAKQAKSYVDVMYASLFIFQELQKTQTNKKKVFMAMAKTSLKDFLAFRHSLMTLEKQHAMDLEAVTVLLDQVVEDALLDPEHICQFDGAVVHAAIWKKGSKSNDEALEEADEKKSTKRPKAGEAKVVSGLVSYQKNLFDELLRLLSDQEMPMRLKASISGFFEVLVRGFAIRIRAAANTKIEDTKTDLKTSRKRAAIVIATTTTTYSPFKFWSELCAVTYLAFQRETKKSDFLPVLVTLYNALFRALCECDIYRVTEDTEERKQFLTMENILTSFLHVLNVEHVHDVFANADRALEECEVIRSAVRCSPNLANGCLVPIFELLGVQANKAKDGNAGVYAAASHALIELIHAYDSMRLLDRFLKAVFATPQAYDGLYKLFAVPLCEAALRKAFMLLPPGQTEMLWKLLVEQIASFAFKNDDICNARGVAVARLLFQIFAQEIHVVPSNRSKVLRLILHTHEQLLSSFATELTHVMGSFTSYRRELFCILGELLMFDTVLNASICEQTFDQIFDKLEGDRFGAVMEHLLSVCPLSIETEGSKKQTGCTMSGLSINHGVGAAGIIKLCVFWLRKTRALNETTGDNASEGREKITRLVIKYVVNWKCWEAVSFYLPELMANASSNECDLFFREILSAYINIAPSGESEVSAKRIICDAGFYEIPRIRSIAPVSLTSLGKRFVGEVHRGSLTSLELSCRFFGFLLEIPSSYLIPQECGQLLLTALTLYHAICMSFNNVDGNIEARHTLLTWVQQYFKVIGVELQKSGKMWPEFKKQLRSRTSFIVSQLVADDSVSVALVAEMLGYFLDIGANAFVGELLNDVLNGKNIQTESTDKITRILKRAVIVVEALAAYRTAPSVSKEEKEFIENVVEIVTRENVCGTTQGPLSFEVLTALLKYQSAVHKLARQHKNQQTKADDGRVLQLLLKHVGGALTASMKLVAMIGNSTDSIELQDAAWSFFANFCEQYSSFQTFLTPLQTYGCLLAVALSLIARNTTPLLSQNKAELAALQAVVANANKDEFRLLLSTLMQELVAREGKRKLGALCALYVLLVGDRKLNASRRLLLNKHKKLIVEALLENFAAQLLLIGAKSADPFDNAVALHVWSLRVFVLMFSKAELFSWKNPQLQYVLTGFQPLLAAVSCWQAGTNRYNPQELHELWTLSYTLLLRIVRSHFASLVHCIPQLVQASNALFQMLVLTSAHLEYSQICSEWSSNLARLYGYMKAHDVQLRKHVIYLLMAFLVSVTRDKLAVRFQQKLRPGVFALLDVCSPYEKEQLFGALDSTEAVLRAYRLLNPCMAFTVIQIASDIVFERDEANGGRQCYMNVACRGQQHCALK
ncbi:unnamed protein product [Peronospora belbahrii]|uniref:Nucleolar 27S pre-rRNA processing Urb2/Npa2 C-terminal domain-containing protein n=1 Tax=Peronospora belbahrii TaxID=622444 RepID=A0ABN8D5W4_9STRA|nr:unnamed protein product [Peronospora belbahrii]